jgi:NitT/TauT family transport system permease protein
VVEASMVDGANNRQTVLKIELPQIAPSVYSAIGSGISLNFKLMVAAEVLSATLKSLGNLLNNAKYSFDIALMHAMVIFAVIFGIVIEAVFNKISKKSGEWR